MSSQEIHGMTSPDANLQAQTMYAALVPEDAQKGIRRAQTVVVVLMILLSWFAHSLEVFQRYNFGERYFTLTKTLLTFLTLKLFIALSRALVDLTNDLFNPLQDFNQDFSRATRTVDTGLLEGIAGLYLLVAIGHHGYIYWRNYQGVRWHSYNLGNSWIENLQPLAWLEGEKTLPFTEKKVFIQLGEWFYYRWFEPLLCLIPSYFLFNLNPAFFLWLIMASGAMFLRNNAIYFQHRSRLLDIIDAQLEAQYTQEDLNPKGRPKSTRNRGGLPAIAQPVANPYVSARSVASNNLKETVQDVLGGARSDESPANGGVPSTKKQAISDTIAEVLQSPDED